MRALLILISKGGNIFSRTFHHPVINLILCLNIAFYLQNIAFTLKRIGKLYLKKQHPVIVQNNHIAETGLAPVNDGFIHKELRRSRYNVEEINCIFTKKSAALLDCIKQSLAVHNIK